MGVTYPTVARGFLLCGHHEMDVTMKGGQRMKMTELCIYHVKDGKIVSEQFLM